MFIQSFQHLEVKFHDELNETVGRVGTVSVKSSWRTLDDNEFVLRSTVQSEHSIMELH